MSNSTNIAELGKPDPPAVGGEFSAIAAGGEPETLIKWAVSTAGCLTRVIEDRRLYIAIKGKRFVTTEGWNCLAAMCGLAVREVSVTEDERGDYIAVVELVRLSDGAIVGRGSAVCGKDEPTWANRPRYARRSMALTRAAGKACRLALSWIVKIAGFDTTTAEEVEGVATVETPPSPPPVVPESKPSQTMTIDATVVDTTSASIDGPCDAAQVEQIRASLRELGSPDLAREILSNHGVNKIAELSHAKAQTLLGELSTRAVEKQLSL